MELKVGDKVKIVGPQLTEDGYQKKWNEYDTLYWTTEMDALIGIEAVIVEGSFSDYGLNIPRFENYGFSDDWLEKVE